MSAKQDKRMRREVRHYLKEAGARPEDLRRNFLDMLRPRPRWLPLWFWLRLARFVLKSPMEISDGQVRLVDTKSEEPASRAANGRCFKCGGFHTLADCPSAPVNPNVDPSDPREFA